MLGLTTTQPRRRTELGLILIVCLITLGAYILASLGSSASLPANVIPFLGIILGLLGLAHMGLRRFAPNADSMLLPLAGLLNGLGYVFIARLDRDLAALQATWTAIGIAAFLTTLVVVPRARNLEQYRYTFGFLGVFLLLLPLVPGLGRTVNGAKIWVGIGPMRFQPGEMAKIALAIFLAGYLAEKGELLSGARKRFAGISFPDLKYFGPLIVWFTSLAVMILQKDLGSSLLFFGLFVVLLWVATGAKSFLIAGSALFVTGALAAWQMFSHVQERVDVWLNPWPVASGSGYQVVQSMFALGTGGVTGTGIALGSPDRIPAVETDFIFAAIGEELGFIGTVAILTAFILMVGAGLRIAIRAENDFEKLLATGLTAILGLQSFIIIAGVIRLVPLTGVTLPFMSYGGSSLVANYILLALLLRVSHDSAKVPA